VSSEAECNVGWLLFVLRARRHQSECSAGLPCASQTLRERTLHRIAGGSGLPDEALRQSVRERLADGRLFWPSGISVVRRGTGRPCNVCGKAIWKDSTERQVDGPRETYALAHEDCYKIWREESRSGQPPPI
jgi:hypothetical protein